MAGAINGILMHILIQVGSDTVRESGSVIGVTKELKKLENTLATMRDAFKDADEQQQNSDELTNCFKRIKDAMYQAEDIMDDFATEALRQKLRIQESSMKKVLGFAYSIKSAALGFEMSRRIKEVRQKFDEIAADINMFKLIRSVPGKRGDNPDRGQTISFVVEEKVFGRDDDRDKILELLSDADGESVVTISGAGGMGKTTLAQLVYNHKTVDSLFELKMWVFVSWEFDVKKIIEKIVKSVTNQECHHLEMGRLQSLLEEHLKGKRFLLVLDDVWDKDMFKWDDLKILLPGGAKGTKIVVTTRSFPLACIIGARDHELKPISKDDSWNLFKERAFAKGEAEKQPNLVTIGKEMLWMCYGVPLFVKALGSLMRFKTREHEWVSAKNTDVWRFLRWKKSISRPLKVCYIHLPFHLKQCISICATYPKGFPYETRYIIEEWIALGFVFSFDKSQYLEDIGYEYVQELLWRSLFSEPEYDENGVLYRFKVHDLVHDLVQEVVGMEFYVFEGALDVQNEDKQKKIDVQNQDELRHLNLLQCPPSLALEVVCNNNMPNLRSLLFKTEFPVDDIFSNLRTLRNLSLHVVGGSLPSSIRKLKHLRRLSLVSMDIQTLPNSITKLVNLQALDLKLCPKLSELPTDIGKMINLRHITIAKDAPISYMPQGIGKLASLQTLSVFVVGKGIGCKLNELQGLIHLSGVLIIKNLQNVSSVSDCIEANLKQKKKLLILELKWDDQEDKGNTNGAETHVTVLETLEPHSDLKGLIIEGYRSSEFPRWIMEPVFPRLEKIILIKCRKCECLPPFGQLPSLHYLLLEDMDVLRCIEVNGIADRQQAELFPSLKELWLERLPNLESWILGEEGNLTLFSLPCLVNLVIRGCPKLRNIPLLPTCVPNILLEN